jgi:ParB family chromosome partitioning protein
MSSRKNQLRSLFGAPTPETGSENAAPAAPDAPSKRTTSAAVKAMGLSLGSLSQEAEAARKLRDTLAAGEQVVELDPALIERSPYSDRLSEGARNDEDFEALRASIAEHGQQVPVLVRPHADPDKAARGFYQTAYGHRRVQAARELAKPVRAVVRALDDAALVLAQGKENAERRALSFIERAFFARTLINHGFDRATAQAALSVHKSEMTRLLQVADSIPEYIALAIGPAPKAGRPRWQALGDLLTKDIGGLAMDETMSQPFRDADSDTRFQRLFDRLGQSARGRMSAKKGGPRQITDDGGTPIADLAKAGRTMRLTIAADAGEGFADFVADELPRLHEAFRASQKDRLKDQ